MTSPNPAHQTTPENLSESDSLPRNAVSCACGAWWAGLKTCHCPTCHTTFTTVSAFDKHRTGSHADSDRHCLDPTTVGLVDAGRAYPCLGWPIYPNTELRRRWDIPTGYGVRK